MVGGTTRLGRLLPPVPGRPTVDGAVEGVARRSRVDGTGATAQRAQGARRVRTDRATRRRHDGHCRIPPPRGDGAGRRPAAAR